MSFLNTSIKKKPFFFSEVVICKKFYKNLNDQKSKKRKRKTVLLEI